MNKNHLIIGIFAIVIVLLCCGIGYLMFAEHTEYVPMTIAESGTILEIPKDMQVKSNDTDSGIIVLGNDNTIVVLFNSADKGLSPLMEFAAIKIPFFGNHYQGNTTLKNPNVVGSSLDGDCNAVYIGNNDTHDNIIVISKNKNIVSHIINSIKWGKTASSDDVSESQSTDSGPSAYAYKSDGTPMYSESEVKDYMQDKYGEVDYHVGDNGYIDMDEPGYDDAGHKINN